ncbi:MAG: SDR family NAD(P)-dependent oxidoreductase [Acidimicrobiia bacterium]
MIELGLTGRRALVAGAGHRPPRPGIGRAAALALAEAGCRVACVDLDASRAAAVAEEITAGGGEAIAVTADLTDRDGAAQAVAAAVDAFGGLDVVADVIGEARWGSVLDFTDEDWEWSLATNLRQAFLVMQAAARQMVAQGTGGAMAVVSSVDSLTSSANHVAYGAAKAGLLNLVKTFAEELGRFGIRANAVLPGMVWSPTEQQHEPPPGNAINPLRQPSMDDIARALTFFVSDLAGAVTGQALAVDGGASIKNEWGIRAQFPTLTGD